MKRILIVCLLGMGLLLPSTTITAKEFFIKRIVNCTLEGDALRATSDVSTGTITELQVFNSNNQKVRDQKCSGYTCDVSLSGLPSGGYRAHVITTLTTYDWDFTR